MSRCRCRGTRPSWGPRLLRRETQVRCRMPAAFLGDRRWYKSSRWRSRSKGAIAHALAPTLQKIRWHAQCRSLAYRIQDAPPHQRPRVLVVVGQIDGRRSHCCRVVTMAVPLLGLDPQRERQQQYQQARVDEHSKANNWVGSGRESCVGFRNGRLRVARIGSTQQVR